MSLLWAVPPVVMTLAGVMSLRWLRRIAEASTELQDELALLSELGDSVAEVRRAGAETRATLEGLRRA